MELTYKDTKMEIVPALEEEQIYSYSSIDEEAEQACIGHLRGDFGTNGNEFWTTWWPHKGDPGPECGKDCYEELNQVVAALRENGLLKDRATMTKQMRKWSKAVIKSAYSAQIALCIETKQQLYYLRCNPLKGDYNFYLYMYDKPLLMEVQRKAKKLPLYCVKAPGKHTVPVLITYGEEGFARLENYEDTSVPLMVRIESFNDYYGAGKAEISAMVNGATFGWHRPGSNPKEYDEQGRPINERNARTQNEQSR